MGGLKLDLILNELYGEILKHLGFNHFLSEADTSRCCFTIVIVVNRRHAFSFYITKLVL